MHSSTLPSRAAPFIGRIQELAQLRAVVQRAPLVVLVGPPGAGKTRLAEEFAARAPHPAHLCSLSDARTEEDACVKLAQTLRVSLSTGDHPAQLGAALSARAGELVILDNCEQIEGIDALLARWLRLAPGSKFLATSRTTLPGAGGETLRLGPLPLPVEGQDPLQAESVQLFLERARSARPRYEPSADELSTIAALVAQLDGLPLAIELAAARIRIVTPAQILAYTARRFLLLRQQEWEDPRHATLQGALDWSWSLLAPHEQAALAQCSTFRGGFSLEAAEAVLSLSDAPPILDVLQSLHEKSLLQREEPALFPRESRFSLYVSVREYGQAQLTPEERFFLEQRHSRYYLRAGEQWRQEAERRDSHAARCRLELERENVIEVHQRALQQTPPAAEEALHAALIVSPMLAQRGPFTLRLALLERALAAGEVPDAPKAAALHQRGIALQALGQAKEALASFEQARALCAPLSLPALQARIEGSIAEHHTRTGRFADAEAASVRALATNRSSDDPLWEGSILNNIGLLRDAQGDRAGAEERFRAALHVYQRVEAPDLAALVRGNLASVHAANGAREEARSLLAEVLSYYETREESATTAIALANLALLDQERGEFGLAQEEFSRAIQALRRLGYRTHEAMLLGSGLGLCQQEAGQFMEAQESYLRALAIYEQFQNPIQEGLARCFYGSLLASTGRRAEATQQLARGREMLGNSPLSGPVHALASAFVTVLDWKERAAALDFDGAEQQRAAAEEALRAAALLSQRSTQLRTLSRLLRQRVAALPARHEALFVAEDGGWFSCLGGEHVVIAKRRALPQILALLAQRRRDAPGSPISQEELQQAGWPNEKLLPQAAHNRLYVAISTLRGLGLKEVLRSQEEGWLLAPEVPLFLSPSEAPSRAREKP